jgi:hypothetical protein
VKVAVPALFLTILASYAFAQQDQSGLGDLLYPPLPRDEVAMCEAQLRYAEQQLATEMAGMNYTVTIAAKSAPLVGEPVKCSITVNRSYAIETLEQED